MLRATVDPRDGRGVPLSEAASGTRGTRSTFVRAFVLVRARWLTNSMRALSIRQPDKAYSRDFLEVGRIRVLLKADGKPVNPEVPHST